MVSFFFIELFIITKIHDFFVHDSSATSLGRDDLVNQRFDPTPSILFIDYNDEDDDVIIYKSMVSCLC